MEKDRSLFNLPLTVLFKPKCVQEPLITNMEEPCYRNESSLNSNKDPLEINTMKLRSSSDATQPEGNMNVAVNVWERPQRDQNEIKEREMSDFQNGYDILPSGLQNNEDFDLSVIIMDSMDSYRKFDEENSTEKESKAIINAKISPDGSNSSHNKPVLGERNSHGSFKFPSSALDWGSSDKNLSNSGHSCLNPTEDTSKGMKYSSSADFKINLNPSVYSHAPITRLNHHRKNSKIRRRNFTAHGTKQKSPFDALEKPPVSNIHKVYRLPTNRFVNSSPSSRVCSQRDTYPSEKLVDVAEVDSLDDEQLETLAMKRVRLSESFVAGEVSAQNYQPKSRIMEIEQRSNSPDTLQDHLPDNVSDTSSGDSIQTVEIFQKFKSQEPYFYSNMPQKPNHGSSHPQSLDSDVEPLPDKSSYIGLPTMQLLEYDGLDDRFANYEEIQEPRTMDVLSYKPREIQMYSEQTADTSVLPDSCHNVDETLNSVRSDLKNIKLVNPDITEAASIEELDRSSDTIQASAFINPQEIDDWDRIPLSTTVKILEAIKKRYPKLKIPSLDGINLKLDNAFLESLYDISSLLPNIHSLDISNNEFQSFGGLPSSLTVLECRNCPFIDLNSLFHLRNLETLDLRVDNLARDNSKNEAAASFKNFSQLSKIKNLFLDGRKIESWSGISDISHCLVKLSINNCGIGDIAADVKDLNSMHSQTEIRYLYANKNMITNLLDLISYFEKVEVLELSYNKIRRIGNFDHLNDCLRLLDLSFNQLARVQNTIPVKSIKLDGNPLKMILINPQVNECFSLRKISRQCSLRFSRKWADTKNLVLKELIIADVALTSNSIAHLFQVIGEITSLESITLNRVSLRHIPSISKLVNLKKLNLANNRLTTLEDLPPELPILHTLDLSNNELQNFVICLKKLDSYPVERIYLAGNRFSPKFPLIKSPEGMLDGGSTQSDSKHVSHYPLISDKEPSNDMTYVKRIIYLYTILSSLGNVSEIDGFCLLNNLKHNKSNHSYPSIDQSVLDRQYRRIRGRIGGGAK